MTVIKGMSFATGYRGNLNLRKFMKEQQSTFLNPELSYKKPKYRIVWDSKKQGTYIKEIHGILN